MPKGQYDRSKVGRKRQVTAKGGPVKTRPIEDLFDEDDSLGNDKPSNKMAKGHLAANNQITAKVTEIEEVRDELARIAENNDGRLNPDTIVDAARSRKSILHDYFQWDDSVAGEQFRRAQAIVLIKKIRFTIVLHDPETKQIGFKTVRQYQSRPSQRGPGGGYEDIEDIMSDSEKRTELLQAAFAELSAFRRRYEDLEELSSVLMAIDEVLPPIRKKQRRA
jgi:hypothetical protein